MQKCDFCKQTATHVRKNGAQVISYLCTEHACKFVSTRYPIELIATVPSLTAVCSLCGEDKSADEFYYYTDTRGVRRRRSECKQCNLEERKKRRLKKK